MWNWLGPGGDYLLVLATNVHFCLNLTAGECHEVKWISVTDIVFTQIWEGDENNM